MTGRPRRSSRPGWATCRRPGTGPPAPAEPCAFERLGAGLALFFELTARNEAGEALFAGAAAALRPGAGAGGARAALLGMALAEQARLLVRQHEYDRAAPILEEAERLAEAAGRPWPP